MLALFLFLCGLVVGPLLGVIVDRAVDREKLAAEHRCQVCRCSLGNASLLPVFSWFRRCPTDTSHSWWRYPLTDLATAAAFAAAGVRFGMSIDLVPYLLFFAALVTMSVIDIETHLLLNILTYPTLLAGLVLVLVLSGSDGAQDRIWPALIGALLFGGILGAAFLAYPPGMGLGDVKLAPSLGLFLGWMSTEQMIAVRLVFYAILLSFLVAGVSGVILNAIRGDRRAEIPMGPFLAAATIVIVAAAPVSAAVVG
ncbi:MAG: leader peptidase (prepilin peptidase)/N-methyltransferase [Acidimicrobiales bacterium]|jgi:leader peptidase (prepilin peptidase) / N-methyltransferase